MFSTTALPTARPASGPVLTARPSPAAVAALARLECAFGFTTVEVAATVTVSGVAR